MSNKRNILFLSSWYPSRVMPTNGNFVRRHAEAVALYHRVAALYVVSDEHMDKDGFEVDARDDDGIFTVNVYYPKGSNILQKLYRYYKGHKLGLQQLRKHMPNIDLVHVNVLFPVGIVAWWLRSAQRIPYIITEHWTGYHIENQEDIPCIQKWVSRLIAASSSVISPVSENLAKMMKQFGLKGNYQVVPNVVDTTLFTIDSTPKPQGAKTQLLHISTLNEKNKNVSGILRVIQELSTQRQDFELLIVSDGDLEPHIEYAKQLGILDTFVYFKGAQPINTIANIMRKADIFVLFSNYENLPCVIIESHASGIPVLSTNVGGISEMVNQSNGILIEAGDEAGMLNELNQLFDTYHTYNKLALREEAINRFSYATVGAQYSAIYESVLNP